MSTPTEAILQACSGPVFGFETIKETTINSEIKGINNIGGTLCFLYLLLIMFLSMTQCCTLSRSRLKYLNN